MKKFFIYSLIFVFMVAVCSAKEVQFTEEDYNISLEYNDQVKPGDPVFVRMNFEGTKGAKKKSLNVTAKLEVFNNKKSAGACQFYVLSSKKNTMDMLAGIALSSYAATGNGEVRIAYNLNGEGEKKISLPITVEKKQFVSGVINLTQNMSNISSDTSPEKVEQSKRLNAIINATNLENVFGVRKFIPPVTSKRRTTEYAERIIYKYPSGKESTTVHTGIDYGKPNRDAPGHMDIVAPCEGKVVMAEDRIATGWTIIIEHLPGFYSMYYHMTEIKVSVGQMVKQGELIGISGATGFATGEHLHWELRLNSQIVNPDFFMDNDFTFPKVSQP